MKYVGLADNPEQGKPTQKKLEKCIRNRMWELRCAVGSGDDSNLVVWVTTELACAQRPLRDHPDFGDLKPLPPVARELVIRWVDRVIGLTFRSIICLLHWKELNHYDEVLHPCGLLEYLRFRELVVDHLPWPDPAHGPPEERARRKEMVEEIKDRAVVAFGKLPKPVLMFCSAGIDRSPPVAAFIVEQTRDASN